MRSRLIDGQTKTKMSRRVILVNIYTCNNLLKKQYWGKLCKKNSKEIVLGKILSLLRCNIIITNQGEDPGFQSCLLVENSHGGFGPKFHACRHCHMYWGEVCVCRGSPRLAASTWHHR